MTGTKLPPITPQIVLRYFAYTFVFNSSIAGLLTIIRFGAGFTDNFLFSQCIGLSICASVMLSIHLAHPQQAWKLHLSVLAGIAAGVLIGTILGYLITDTDPIFSLPRTYLFYRTLAIGVAFGLAGSYLLVLRSRVLAADQQSQEEKINRLILAKQMTETELRLLQAQIEPHFLFNTLSNILSLMENHPDKAKSMLIDFLHYLRLTLSITREESNTLAREMELIKAYLNLFQIRMGSRLKYEVSFPDALKETPIAPMLLQPLVENAVKHGVEPMIEGGEIIVSAQAFNGVLKLEVADTGGGFVQDRPGLGLSNVKERLTSLYGGKAHLYFEENQPRGVRVVIEAPL